jgi:hypothetical protein
MNGGKQRFKMLIQRKSQYGKHRSFFPHKKIIALYKNLPQLTSVECLLQNLTAVLYWLQGTPSLVLRGCIVSTCKFAV